jgi:iron transport multicopper oxidase
MPKLINYYLGNSNTDGAEPIPDAGLINDKMNETLKIYPGKSYLFRFVSMSALASHVVTFGKNLQNPKESY